MRIDMRTEDSRTDKAKYRVLLDGVEVTTQCFLSDDETGEVGLYLKDDSGHFHRLPGADGAVQEIRRGRVVLIPPEGSVSTGCLCLYAIEQEAGRPVKHDPRCHLAGDVRVNQ